MGYHVSCKDRKARPSTDQSTDITFQNIERVKNGVMHVNDSLSEHVENNDGLRKEIHRQSTSVYLCKRYPYSGQLRQLIAK